MRAGLSTIQQTLTPEASSVLNHSICEAQRRNHGQTTPLHVASSLLASQTGYLRHACIRSHPNSSHPLQCRALELCFSVALDRLPSSQNLSPGFEPPISNALMAALKRAQAHQRRGCPEQQQQPLLAVKVELEQLIVSILDDPSVSRVMREASFSSPAVKAAIEESLNASTSVNSSAIIGLGFRPAPTSNINLYLNPRLKQGNSLQLGQPRIEEVKRIIDIMLKKKKRNPVLVGENEPDAVVMELFRRIEKREVEEELLKNVQVISLDKDFASDRSQISSKMKDLGLLIENRISNNGGSGVILNLGDLKWLVEQPVNLGISSLNPMKQQIISETGKVVVTEMGKILARFGEESGRLWLIGTATCETYLRCQVYHPSMENEWDLQAVPITARAPVPITARAPVPQLFPRKHEIFGINGNLGNSVQALTPLKSFPSSATTLSRYSSENMDPTRRKSSCSRCMENYEQELQKLKDEIENSTSDAKPEAAQSTFPAWLQIGKLENSNSKATDISLIKDKELLLKQKTEELQRKWNDTCVNIHPNFHLNLSLERITPISFSSNHQQLQLTRGLGITFQMKQSSSPSSPREQASSPPRSPVRTDLVLGNPKLHENSPEKTHKARITDINGCIPSEPQDKFSELNREKLVTPFDADSFKKLYKGLIEKVRWQPEAASAVATTVIRCKSGARNRQGTSFKGVTWLLFAGSDRIGKKNMASAMAELIGGSNLITIQLGSQCHENEEQDMNFRGKTLLDRMAEAIRRNPFSVILLEDLDQSDMLIQGSIKRAIERGRLADSHGREINLGNVIFILTVNFVPEDPKNLSNSPPLMEEKLASLASNGWQLQLLVSSKSGKRRPDWFSGDNRLTKPRKDSGPALSFDLNQIADNAGDETGEGSRNSSDLTSEHEHERNLVNKLLPTKLVSQDFFNFVDGTVIFKPVDFGPLRRKITTSIASTCRFIMGDERLIGVDDEALEKIVAGIWFGQIGLEEWIEKFLIPSFNHLKSTFPAAGSGSDYSGDDSVVIRLVSVRESERQSAGDLLPEKITVVVDGL